MRISDWSSDVCSSDLSYAKKTLQKDYKTLDEFLRRWGEAEKKQVIIEELESLGVSLDGLRDEVKNGDAFSAFDLLCHVAYGQPPLTRKERAEQVKRSEEHTSELQSLMRISYAVFCSNKKQKYNHQTIHH